MIFTLEPLQAAEGDCLLLHWDSDGARRLAIIDGGPGTIWEKSLRPRLEELADANGDAPLTVDLVMVSHVDADHIVGIKKLFRELVRYREKGTPVHERLVDARRLWHNTFNDIVGDALDAHYETMTAGLAASNSTGGANPELERRASDLYRKRYGGSEAEAKDIAHDVALILAGHADARDLRDNHTRLFNAGEIAALNSPFEIDGQPTLITTEHFDEAFDFDGIGITVLGPRRDEIDALQQEFDAYITKQGLSVEAVLAAYADKSVPNLSSIVCLVERDGHRILLTGDARGDKILAALDEAGFAADEPLVVDVLKVPHHGSDRNVDPDFFTRIVADHYVLSGNGKHGNPDRSVIEWIVESRKRNAVYTLAFTYPIDEIDAERKRDAAKHGKPWDDDKDALAPLLAQYAGDGHAFTVVAGAPLRIDLGDEAAPG